MSITFRNMVNALLSFILSVAFELSYNLTFTELHLQHANTDQLNMMLAMQKKKEIKTIKSN